MNTSNIFFIASLLICGLQLKASDQGKAWSPKGKSAVEIEHYKKVNCRQREQAIWHGVADVVQVALIPGQMIMKDHSFGEVGLFDSAATREQKRKATLDQFKQAQRGRCATCAVVAGTLACTAGVVFATGPVAAVEPLASTAAIIAGAGCISTCIPCKDDDHYPISCPTRKEKSK